MNEPNPDKKIATDDESMATDRSTDEELRDLVVVAFIQQDHRATAKLVDLFEDRINGAIRTHVRHISQDADREDALRSILLALWKSLPRVADPDLVEKPWAYVSQTIRNEAQRFGKELDARKIEVSLDELNDRPLPRCQDDLARTDDRMLIERWRSELTYPESEVIDILEESANSGRSESAVLRDRFPGNIRAQMRIKKAIATARRPGGFIQRFRNRLG